MSEASDPELEYLLAIERNACALSDRVGSSRGFLSDPSVLQHAQDLCREAREAVAGYLRART